MQGIRISPDAKRRLASLPSNEKKEVIAEMRKAIEGIIISMTHKNLPGNSEISGFS